MVVVDHESNALIASLNVCSQILCSCTTLFISILTCRAAKLKVAYSGACYTIFGCWFDIQQAPHLQSQCRNTLVKNSIPFPPNPSTFLSSSRTMKILPFTGAITLLAFVTSVLGDFYPLSDDIVGSSFYDEFNFEAITDPTHGRVCACLDPLIRLHSLTIHVGLSETTWTKPLLEAKT
jgi:hypothetical protein